MTQKLTFADAKAIAIRNWGSDGVTAEPCNVEGAWRFRTSEHGGLVIDASIISEDARILMEPYVQIEQGAYALEEDCCMCIAEFAARIYPQSQLTEGVVPPALLLASELEFRRQHFNPRMQRATSDAFIEERLELLEGSDGFFVDWAELHGLDKNDVHSGSALPSAMDIYCAAARAREAQKAAMSEMERTPELA